MRPEILDDQAGVLHKKTLRILETPASYEAPGSIVVMSYRRNLFGKFMARCFQEGMRGASEWSTGEVELLAAFVSRLNECKY